MMNNLVSYGSDDSENEFQSDEVQPNTKPNNNSNSVNYESEWAFFEQMINNNSIPNPSMSDPVKSTNTTSNVASISYPSQKPNYSITNQPTSIVNTNSQPSSPKESVILNNTDMETYTDDKISDILELYYNKWRNDNDEAETLNKNVDTKRKYDPEMSSDSDGNIWKYDLGETDLNNENLKANKMFVEEKTKSKFKETKEAIDMKRSRKDSSRSSHSSVVSTSTSDSSHEENESNKSCQDGENGKEKTDPTTLRLLAISKETVVEEDDKKLKYIPSSNLDKDGKKYATKRSKHSRSRSKSIKRRHIDNDKSHKHNKMDRRSPHHHHNEEHKRHHRYHRHHESSNRRRSTSKHRRSKDDRKDRDKSNEDRSRRSSHHRHRVDKDKRRSSRDRKSSERRRDSCNRRSRSKSIAVNDGKKEETFKDRIKALAASDFTAGSAVPPPPPALTPQQLQLQRDIMIMSKHLSVKGQMPLNSKMAMSAFLAKCTRDKVTPQEALMQSMKAMQAKAQEITGVAVPQYYNPTAINPMKYAEQLKKRKMLWSKKKKVPTATLR